MSARKSQPQSRTARKQSRPATQRLYRAPDPGALLVTRAQAARLLSCSTSTIVRLEAAGRLKAVKLTNSENGLAFYRVEDVRRLASGGEA